MGRVSSNRKTAAALRRTLEQLEEDPSVDPQQPSFILLKCGLLQRLMSLHCHTALEVHTADEQSTLHQVESPEPCPEHVEADVGSAIA